MVSIALPDLSDVALVLIRTFNDIADDLAKLGHDILIVTRQSRSVDTWLILQIAPTHLQDEGHRDRILCCFT